MFEGHGRGSKVTLLARFSTNEIMEFLKSVAAVSGRLVTSVMLSLPSGHIFFSTWLELERQVFSEGPKLLQRRFVPTWYEQVSPVVEQPLEILEERVLVLVDEADHRVPLRSSTAGLD